METGTALIRLAGLCLIAGMLLAGLLFPAVGGAGAASNRASETVNSVSADLVAGEVPLVSTVTDKDGVPIAFLFDQNRFNTPPEAIAD
ncbi:MAG TPA: penicillin-binding protein, partial [Pseudonocardiaceae bacterium]|nr:penicillin-binding protein [Pseudonocardiaceae bacterium]